MVLLKILLSALIAFVGTSWIHPYILKIAKNKEGEAGGVVILDFDGPHQRFAELVDRTVPERPEPNFNQQTFESLDGSGEDLPHGW